MMVEYLDPTPAFTSAAIRIDMHQARQEVAFDNSQGLSMSGPSSCSQDCVYITMVTYARKMCR